MAFSLRFKSNWRQFEAILDDLLHTLKTDKQRFMEEFPNLEVKYWDKILDLSENGEVRKKNSEGFMRLISKCKKLSNAYHSQFKSSYNEDFKDTEEDDE